MKSPLYNKMKWLTIALGVISIPLGTYVGYSLAIERYAAFAIGLSSEAVIYVADYMVWFWVMENMKRE